MGGVAMLLFGMMAGCGSSEPEPAPDKSVISEEISWVMGETNVYATITEPDGVGPYPGIVFVPGSGPTDRDWNSPLLQGTNGSAKLMAEKLANDGFATIRYDKRFTGAHAEENIPALIGNISLESHYDELAGAVEQLAARPEADASRIFVVANSEGVLHAVNYQTQDSQTKFAGLVLIGAPGRIMSDVVETQVAAMLAGEADSEALLEIYRQAINDFRVGNEVIINPDLPEGIKMLLMSVTASANLPFSRELWDADVSEMLAEIDEPVLVVIGKKDVQTDYLLDGGALEAATVNKASVTFSYPDNANHVMKYEEKPREELTPADGATYNLDDRILDSEALETIRGFLISKSS